MQQNVMSWPGSHQGSYATPPIDFVPDHHVRQVQEVYFDRSLQPFDPNFRPFEPSLRQNDIFDYPYDSGIIDHPIEAPGYPVVNDPSTSVPQVQDATPLPKWTLVIPGPTTEGDTVLSLVPSDGSVRFVCELYDSGVHRWTLHSDVDDLKIPGPLPRHVPTVPSPRESDRSTAYSGVNNSYNDSVAPQRHRGNVQKIIDNLPYPLKSTARGWSDRASELVVQKILEILKTDIESMYQCDPSTWNKVLEPLCASKGKLCTVERKGPQGGVTSVTCNYNDCAQSFGHNPAETFARHLIGKHWGIHPFKCERCKYSSDYSHDRKRHQLTCKGV